jgi:nicotinate phosphoribosyltransferase
LTVVKGPLLTAQILETSLLNHLNFQTLIATKAARIREIGRGQIMMEFGLRRGQDKGANAGTRAALIGGADFSSNVGLSALMNLPPKGTHAHSMVQLFVAMGMTELDAFRAFAEIYPDDCTLLVDTINSLESGIPNAIKVFEELRQKGHEPVGIRLDSGDLAFLSIQAARMLDQAGFPQVSIVLSNNLDELIIWQIITQIIEEAGRYGVEPDRLIRRLVYGVGTRLITSWGEPALGGVYKLVAVYHDGQFVPAIKISESPSKTPNPGNKIAWRIYDQRGKATADLLSLEDEDPRLMERIVLRHPSNHTKHRILHLPEISLVEPLLVEIMRDGKQLYEFPELQAIRAQRIADVERLDLGVRRIMYPHIYHVSLTQKLWDLKQRLINTTLGEENG